MVPKAKLFQRELVVYYGAILPSLFHFPSPAKNALRFLAENVLTCATPQPQHRPSPSKVAAQNFRQ